MSTLNYWAAAAVVFLTCACNHENDRPMTPANGTTLSSDPTAPAVDPSVTDTPPAPTPNTTPGVPENDGGSSMPGTRGIDDASQPPHTGPGAMPDGAPGTPSTGTNGAPVGGIH